MIDRKASAYGDLPYPWILGINATKDHPEHIDILNALYGDEAIKIRRSDRGTVSREKRLGNGALRSDHGPRRQQISAFLVGFNLNSWNFIQRPICLYENPWCTNPYTGRLKELSRCPDGDLLKIRPGRPLAEILELPVDWPSTMRN